MVTIFYLFLSYYSSVGCAWYPHPGGDYIFPLKRAQPVSWASFWLFDQWDCRGSVSSCSIFVLVFLSLLLLDSKVIGSTRPIEHQKNTTIQIRFQHINKYQVLYIYVLVGLLGGCIERQRNRQSRLGLTRIGRKRRKSGGEDYLLSGFGETKLYTTTRSISNPRTGHGRIFWTCLLHLFADHCAFDALLRIYLLRRRQIKACMCGWVFPPYGRLSVCGSRAHTK